eukprot:sb/3470228/
MSSKKRICTLYNITMYSCLDHVFPLNDVSLTSLFYHLALSLTLSFSLSLSLSLSISLTLSLSLSLVLTPIHTFTCAVLLFGFRWETILKYPIRRNQFRYSLFDFTNVVHIHLEPSPGGRMGRFSRYFWYLFRAIVYRTSLLFGFSHSNEAYPSASASRSPPTFYVTSVVRRPRALYLIRLLRSERSKLEEVFGLQVHSGTTDFAEIRVQ